MARDTTCIRKLGEGHWEIRIRYKDRLTGAGKIYKKRVKGTLEKAVATRDEARVALYEGRHPDETTTRSGQSLTSYLTRYLKDRGTRGRGGKPIKRTTLEKDANALKHHILPLCGGWIAGHIRRRDLEEIVAEWATWTREVPARNQDGDVVKDEEGKTIYVVEPYSVASINTWLRVLRVYVRWIYELEELGKSPAEDIESMAVTEHRPLKTGKTVLTIEQMQALLTVLRAEYEYYYPLFVLVLCTGGSRIGEITALHWDDIDEDQELIHIRHSQVKGRRTRTKTGVEEVHALPKDVAELLRDHRRRLISTEHPGVVTGIVFPAKVDPTEAANGGYMQRWTLNDILARACKKAKVPRISPHRFRDFVDTRLTARGLHPTIIQSLTGHTTDQMTAHYSHISPKEKAAHLWPILEEVKPK